MLESELVGGALRETEPSRRGPLRIVLIERILLERVQERMLLDAPLLTGLPFSIDEV